MDMSNHINNETQIDISINDKETHGMRSDGEHGSCCGGNHKGHNPMKYMFHMILCCGLPLLILLALPYVARTNPGVAGILGIITPFICPIIMGSMMFFIFGNTKR